MVLFFSLLSILFLLSTYFVNTRLKISFLPSKEECYIKGRTVQVDKLKKKHFQSEAVFPLRFGTRLFCEEREQSLRGLIRLTISLGTKAAGTYLSWQCVCKLAC